MAKALTKSQIAAEIAEKNSITKKQSVEILEQLAALVTNTPRIHSPSQVSASSFWSIAKLG